MAEASADALTAYLSGLSDGARDAALIFTVFLIGGWVYYFFLRRKRRGEGRGVFAYLFPRDLYGHASARSDRWNFFLTYLVWFPVMRVVLSAVLTVVSMQAIYGFLAAAFGAREALIVSPSVLLVFQFLCIFLCSELGSYLAHLAMHRVPILWSIHRVHHSAEALTVFTRLRDHPLDFIWSGLGRVALGAIFAAPILFAVGTPPNQRAIIAYFAVAMMLPFITDAWRHCHMPMSLGWFNRLFNAPIMHQFHHSAEPQHFDKNLGAELMIFDWMFGTLYLPKPDETYRWGLNEREMGANNPHNRLRDFYLEPFRYARALIAKRIDRVQPDNASSGQLDAQHH